MFRSWPDAFPDIEVRAVQLPARQDRFSEPGVSSVAALASSIVEALAALPSSPTLLFGHSFGALLAYEVARRLRAKAAPVLGLVVGARGAPHVPSRNRKIHALPAAEFTQALHEDFGTSLALLNNADLMELAMPSLRADFAAIERYAHESGPKLDCDITVLRGTGDAGLTRAEADKWTELSTGAVRVEEISAGHFFVDSHNDWVQNQVHGARKRGSHERISVRSLNRAV